VVFASDPQVWGSASLEGQATISNSTPRSAFSLNSARRFFSCIYDHQNIRDSEVDPRHLTGTWARCRRACTCSTLPEHASRPHDPSIGNPARQPQLFGGGWVGVSAATRAFMPFGCDLFFRHFNGLRGVFHPVPLQGSLSAGI